MCISPCYYNYNGECIVKTQFYPEDSFCVKIELEKLKITYDKMQDNFQYLVTEAAYKDKVIKNFHDNNYYPNYSKENFELRVFGVILSIFYYGAGERYE